MKLDEHLLFFIEVAYFIAFIIHEALATGEKFAPGSA